MTKRYDPKTGIYRDCKWCGGRGCMSCKIQADRDYAAAFPNGPQPIATFSNTPEGKSQAVEFLKQQMTEDDSGVVLEFTGSGELLAAVMPAGESRDGQ